MTLDILVRELCKNKTIILKMTQDAKTFSRERETITIKQKLVPYKVEVNGKKSSRHHFTDSFNIDGKTYKVSSEVNFRIADPEQHKTLELPAGYIILCQDPEFIEKLLLHNIKIYETNTTVKTESAIIPAHTFYIPTNQESSAIIGFIMEPDAYRKNRFSLVQRALITPLQESIDLNRFKPVKTSEDIKSTIERYNSFFEELLRDQINK
jgi:hypothetical protein